MNTSATSTAVDPAAVPDDSLAPAATRATASAGAVRIVLADDHRMVLSALRLLLGTRPDYRIVASANNLGDLVRMPELPQADLLILDLNLPGPAEDHRSAELTGLRWLPRLRQICPAKILILSMHDESMIVLRALQLGASGFVTKGSPGERLFAAIDAILKGATYVDPSILGVDLPQPQTAASPPPSGSTPIPTAALSRQEREVGHLLLAGLNQKAISHRLGVTPQTTHTYKRRLKDKLGAASDAELLRKLTLTLQ